MSERLSGLLVRGGLVEGGGDSWPFPPAPSPHSRPAASLPDPRTLRFAPEPPRCGTGGETLQSAAPAFAVTLLSSFIRCLNRSTREAESGELSRVRGQPGLQSRTLAQDKQKPPNQNTMPYCHPGVDAEPWRGWGSVQTFPV